MVDVVNLLAMLLLIAALIIFVIVIVFNPDRTRPTWAGRAGRAGRRSPPPARRFLR